MKMKIGIKTKFLRKITRFWQLKENMSEEQKQPTEEF